MEPFLWNGKWLLAKNVHTVGGDGISGTLSRSSERMRETFDGCWTGDRWSPQAATGMVFPSDVEAIAYLNQNWERMEESF